MKRVPNYMTTNARALRNGATDVERAIWHKLSKYRPRFTRQFVIGPYIVDLACRQAKLAIEFDGSQHLERSEQDKKRTRYLTGLGWKVVRYWNSTVIDNPDGVAEDILSQAAECLGGTHPQPLPASREGSRRRSTAAPAPRPLPPSTSR